jgi:hypothetical protein
MGCLVGVCAGLVLSAARPADAQSDPEALVERVLEVYGGWTELSSISAYRMEGAVRTSHGKPPSPTSRVFERTARLKVVLEHPDVKETRILDGKIGWRSDPSGAFAEAEGPLLDSMKLQGARAALPWILAERREALAIIDPLPVEGVSLPGLELSFEPGLRLRVYLDPETSRILRALTVLDHPTMKITFETRYSGFKEVEGVLFAHIEQNYTGGRHTATTTIETIVVNPALAEGEFRP